MVYVDTLIDYGWQLGPSCHMFSDSDDIEELHVFAESIGMKRAWFQMSNGGLPHYDLVRSRRDRAIKKGAIYISDRRVLLEKFNEIRDKLNKDDKR